MAKYVVTGGAGFIGSHLVDLLILADHQVTVVDDLSSGKREHLNPQATFWHGDIRAGESMLEACQGADGVFHLAARARVPVSIADPLGTHDINVNGTLMVLDAARKAKVRRVVFASSSSIYGDQETLPVEETAPLRPLSPYGEQKFIGERYCAMYARLYGVETACLRFFNVYGPRSDPKGAYALVIAKFLAQRLKGEPLTITGDGTQTRDFTHVADVVRACQLAMTVEVIGPGEVFNVGAGSPVDINWVAAAIGGPGYPVVNSEQRNEPKATHASSRKALRWLGWKSRIRLKDGIADLKRQCGL
jgi:nucleoside-diphosphate-sugar epimerase